MPYLVTPDEIPLFYVDEGSRTSSAIFLIHGEPLNTKFWQKNIPDLSRRFRVVAMDVRGRGSRGRLTTAIRWPNTPETSGLCWSPWGWRR